MAPYVPNATVYIEGHLLSNICIGPTCLPTLGCSDCLRVATTMCHLKGNEYAAYKVNFARHQHIYIQADDSNN